MHVRNLTASATALLQSLCASADDPRSAPATMIVAAHPDDEAIGAGARLPRLRRATFVHVTDGAPRDGADARAHGYSTCEAYASARREELLAALRLAGIGPQQTCELHSPDQQASLHLAELSRRLAGIILAVQPAMIVTHPYEGGHPDHDATAFAVHAACRLLERTGAPAPPVIEMTSYHNSDSGLLAGDFLDYKRSPRCWTIELTQAEREFKRAVFDCFASQQDVLAYFPIGVERFRLAPEYDFTQPPHAGRLFYELHSWGMSSERFRGLVRQALDALGLAGPL